MDSPVLSIAQGQLRGTKRRSVYDDSYYSFEGIPFAKPPLGELRFCSPQPAEAWEGIRDCNQVGNGPVQKFPTMEPFGSEDCLYLNVYAKTLNSTKPLPVMVWIYGGGFYCGAANNERYSPDYFMHEDVVFVSFNYRVCSLGFLSLADPTLNVPGNAGLKDQVMALKWVKENISHFNGDANNITVFGESAGGASTHYMTVTEQTRGLFQKAIPMSGCILNCWANVPQTDFGFRLAKQHGYTGENNDRQVLAFLRNLDSKKLVEQDILTEEDKRNGVLFAFTPTVEPYVSKDCVLPTKPLEMLKTAWGNDIPMMLGGTSFEGLLFYSDIKKNKDSMGNFITDVESVLPVDVREQHSDSENRQLAEKLLQAHFDKSVPSQESLLKYLDLFSFKFFWHGFHRTALSRLAHATAPTYLYRFDFDSPVFNLYRKYFVGQDAVRGVAHADDLSYLFYSQESWKLEPETAEFKTIQRMVGIWTAFAKNSNPNCEATKPLNWQPLQKDQPCLALNISEKSEIMELPEREKFKIWNSLYTKETLY